VWVGVEVRPSNPNRFGRSQAVEVAAVAPGSPAERAGVRAGQIIASVAGRPVHTPLDWEARLLDTRVGESLEIAVAAGGDRRTVRLSTQDLPSLTAERIRAGSDFEFVSLTPAIRAERNLSSAEGALIVTLSDAARSLGLREGDLIIQINRTLITSAQDAATLLRRLAGSGPVRTIFERQGQVGSVSFYIGQGS
jgi:S1-C subfamily serine protease